MGSGDSEVSQKWYSVAIEKDHFLSYSIQENADEYTIKLFTRDQGIIAKAYLFGLTVSLSGDLNKNTLTYPMGLMAFRNPRNNNRAMGLWQAFRERPVLSALLEKNKNIIHVRGFGKANDYITKYDMEPDLRVGFSLSKKGFFYSLEVSKKLLTAINHIEELNLGIELGAAPNMDNDRRGPRFRHNISTAKLNGLNQVWCLNLNFNSVCKEGTATNPL